MAQPKDESGHSQHTRRAQPPAARRSGWLPFGCGGTLGLGVGCIGGAGGTAATMVFLLGAAIYQGVGTFEPHVYRLVDDPECSTPARTATPACRAVSTGESTALSIHPDHWTRFAGAGQRAGPHGQGWVTGRFEGTLAWREVTSLSPLTSRGYLVVDAQSNTRKVTLIVDTGASLSLLASDRLADLGLHPLLTSGPVFPGGEPHINGWGARLPMRVLAVADIQTGPMQWDDMVFAVAPVDSPSAHGVLGLGNLGQRLLVVDLAQSRIGVFPSEDAVSDALDLDEDAGTLDDANVVSHSVRPMAPWSLGELSCEALMDTGCVITAVNQDTDLAERVVFSDGVQAKIQSSNIGGVGPQQKLGTLEGLSVNGSPIGPLTVSVGPTGERTLTLCNDVLQHFIIVSNPAEQRTWLLDAQALEAPWSTARWMHATLVGSPNSFRTFTLGVRSGVPPRYPHVPHSSRSHVRPLSSHVLRHPLWRSTRNHRHRR